MKPPVPIGVLRKLLKEVQASAQDEKPLAVGGARELAAVLRKELGRGGGAGRGAEQRRAGGRRRLRPRARPRAERGGRAGAETRAPGPRPDRRRRRRHGREDVSIPYVLATDVVRVHAGEGFSHEAIAQAIAGRLGEEGAPLAARLPFLRRAVCERLVAAFARKNGIVAAAVFVPGADLPVLARNQVRLLLRLDQAYGLELDPRSRAPEVLAVLAAGIGLRTVARELLDLVPVAGWAVKGAVAYAGTRALGEAAIRRLEAGVPGGHASS